jgi:hypothetical protein
MFKTFKFNIQNPNTPPILSKAKDSPLLVHQTHIHYLHHLLEHCCCNTCLIFTSICGFNYYYSSSSSLSSFVELHMFIHLSMNMYPICSSSCGLQKWKQNEVSLFFSFSPFPFGFIPSPRIDYLFSWAMVGSCHGDPLFQLVDT